MHETKPDAAALPSVNVQILGYHIGTTRLDDPKAPLVVLKLTANVFDGSKPVEKELFCVIEDLAFAEKLGCELAQAATLGKMIASDGPPEMIAALRATLGVGQEKASS